MIEAEMKEYIEENKKYICGTIIANAYDLNLIDTYAMYIETRISILKHQLQNNTSPKQNKDKIKKEKEFLFNEFGISQATFYRYLSNGIAKITNPILFRIMVTTGKTTLTKELLNGTNDTYKTITNYVNTRILKDNSNTELPVTYKYYFEKEISPEYCYKLWHRMVEPCYTSDTAYDFKLIIKQIRKKDNNTHIHITLENNNTTNPNTKITNSIWILKDNNYLTALGKRIDSWHHLNNDADNSSIFVVQNLSGNKKISRYLELIALNDQKITLFT